MMMMMVHDAKSGLSWINHTFAGPDTGCSLAAVVDYNHIRILPSGFHTPVAVAVGHNTEPSSSVAVVVVMDSLALEPDELGLALAVACTYRQRFVAFEDMDYRCLLVDLFGAFEDMDRC